MFADALQFLQQRCDVTKIKHGQKLKQEKSAEESLLTGALTLYSGNILTRVWRFCSTTDDCRQCITKGINIDFRDTYL